MLEKIFSLQGTPPSEKEDHLQKCLGGGHASSQEGSSPPQKKNNATSFAVFLPQLGSTLSRKRFANTFREAKRYSPLYTPVCKMAYE